jgi:hypothetical protein
MGGCGGKGSRADPNPTSLDSEFLGFNCEETYPAISAGSAESRADAKRLGKFRWVALNDNSGQTM